MKPNSNKRKRLRDANTTNPGTKRRGNARKAGRPDPGEVKVGLARLKEGRSLRQLRQLLSD